MSTMFLAICLCLVSMSAATPKIVDKKYSSKEELESIGIEFIDTKGDLNNLIEFEVEILAEGFGFLEGPVFIDDYLLFTEPIRANIWKYDITNKKIEIWKSWDEPEEGGCTGLAHTKSYPDELWIACMYGKKVVHLNMTTKAVIDSYDHKTYHKERDAKFEVNDIVIDDKGNVYFTGKFMRKSL